MIKTMFGFGKNKNVKAAEAENTNGKKKTAAEEKSEEEKVVITKDMLVTDALKDLCRRQNQLYEIHCLVLENMWFDDFKGKSFTHQGK